MGCLHDDARSASTLAEPTEKSTKPKTIHPGKKTQHHHTDGSRPRKKKAKCGMPFSHYKTHIFSEKAGNDKTQLPGQHDPPVRILTTTTTALNPAGTGPTTPPPLLRLLPQLLLQLQAPLIRELLR